MPFPLAIGSHELKTPADLMRLVLQQLSDREDGSEQQALPSTWLSQLSPEQLTPKELTALTAALVMRPEAPALCEAARLTEHLNDQRLGGLLLQACISTDLGLLLTPAPGHEEASVEDLLLRAITATADLSDATLRAPLLTRLRSTGHSLLELDILTQHGSPEELLDAVPGLLAEGVTIPETQRQRLMSRIPDDHDAHGTLSEWLHASS